MTPICPTAPTGGVRWTGSPLLTAEDRERIASQVARGRMLADKAKRTRKPRAIPATWRPALARWNGLRIHYGLDPRATVDAFIAAQAGVLRDGGWAKRFEDWLPGYRAALARKEAV